MPDEEKEKPREEDLLDLLRKHGLTDEEIAKLGNDEATWASIQRQHEKKVIKVNITIPEGQDREISPKEFAELLDAGKDAVNTKILLSTGLSISWSLIKAATQNYLNKQTGGLVG